MILGLTVGATAGIVVFRQVAFGDWSWLSRPAKPSKSLPNAADPSTARAPSSTAAAMLRADPALRRKYTVVGKESFDFATTARIVVSIRLPKGMGEAEMELQTRAAAYRHFQQARTEGVRLGALKVLTYWQHDDIVAGSIARLRLTFAPDGRWGNADASIPIRKWTARLEGPSPNCQEMLDSVCFPQTKRRRARGPKRRD